MTGTPASSRSQRLKMAVAASLLSKVSSVLVQVVALPAAIAALGSERYGAFSATTASVSWITLVTVGSGPSLTQMVSVASAAEDRASERAVFSNGLTASALASLITFAVLQFFAVYSRTPQLLGHAVVGHVQEARTTLQLVALLVPVAMFCGVVDALLAGYQEQKTTFHWAFVLSLLTFPLLLLVARGYPTLLFMAVALFFPNALVKALCLGQLAFITRPYLRFKASLVDRTVLRRLFLNGLVFMMLSAGSYINTQLLIYVAGLGGAARAAQVGVLMQIGIMVLSFVAMFGNALWPALIEAKEKGDHAWMKRAIRASVTLSGSLGLLAFVGLGFGAAIVARYWYKIPIESPATTSWAFGLFMLATILENTLISIAVGLDRLKRVAVIFLGRSIVAGCLYPVVYRIYGIEGILLLGAASVACGPIWLMARLVKRSMPQSAAPAPG